MSKSGMRCRYRPDLIADWSPESLGRDGVVTQRTRQEGHTLNL